MVDVTFYASRDGDRRTIKPELFSRTAEELAAVLSQGDDRLNKRTQIRRFYDEVVRLNALARSGGDDSTWEDILPYLNMLIAKAAYAEGRKLVSEEFVKFIRDAIGQVSQPRDLAVFANLFEAFMGFYRKYRQSN